MAQSSNPQVPRHVAIIMDGNGRWAKERGLKRIEGHKVGAESVTAVVRACREAGVEYLTLYAFSTENWVRPPSEVAGLMALLQDFLTNRVQELHENKIRLRAIGRLADLPATVRNKLQAVIKATEHYTAGNLTVALSYGGRAELTDAVRQIASKIEAGELKVKDITEDTISAHLYDAELPDPDFMIRTSGEQRLSNFLPWQLTYAEFYFTPVPWPDFREAQFMEALDEYARRRRRYGDID